MRGRIPGEYGMKSRTRGRRVAAAVARGRTRRRRADEAGHGARRGGGGRGRACGSCGLGSSGWERSSGDGEVGRAEKGGACPRMNGGVFLFFSFTYKWRVPCTYVEYRGMVMCVI